MSVQELYQEIIVEHSKHPQNFRIIDSPSHKAEGLNPLCGDCVDIYLKIEAGVVVDASFQGSGCAISRASASLLTQEIIGKPVETARTMIQAFRDGLLCRDQTVAGSGCEFGDAALLENVKRFPTRINCALLPWNTLRDALPRNS